MTVRTSRPTRQLAVENDPPSTSSKRQVTSADAAELFSAKQNLQQNCSWKNSQQALSSPARITGCAAAEASSTPKAALRLSRVEKDERLKLHVPKTAKAMTAQKPKTAPNRSAGCKECAANSSTMGCQATMCPEAAPPEASVRPLQ